MAQHVSGLKQAFLVCLLAGWSLLAPAQEPTGVRSTDPASTPLATDDPLALWFKEQDRLLDDILLRLVRIETLVGEIHRLVKNLPQPPTPPAPMPVPPRAEAGMPADWLPYLGGGLLFALLFFWLRQRPTTVPPAPTDRPAAPVAAPRAPRGTAAGCDDLQQDPAIELAELMLSMGLGQGAADTLIEQIRQEPKRALRHWLKLLEIYRQTGLQEEFERSAEELRQHFNVRPEDWHSQPGVGASLEDYPHIAPRLVELWGSPGCLPYLQNLLSDNRGGTRNGFPQAVAEELLLLSVLAGAAANR